MSGRAWFLAAIFVGYAVDASAIPPVETSTPTVWASEDAGVVTPPPAPTIVPIVQIVDGSVPDASSTSGAADAGVAAAVPTEVVPGPAVREPPEPYWRRRLFQILWWAFALFLLLRVMHALIQRFSLSDAAQGIVRRSWPLLEGSVWIVFVLAALLDVPGPRADTALHILLGGFVLVVAMLWNPLRDVAAGLIFAVERPFDLNDFVRVGGVEGQVKRLRLRVVEVLTSEGALVQVPYRALASSTSVRQGGARVAHAVRVRFAIPAGADPAQTLKEVVELASTSPWAVLGAPPRATLDAPGAEDAAIDLEAYAFAREAQTLLHADLLRGYSAIAKRFEPDTDTGPTKSGIVS